MTYRVAIVEDNATARATLRSHLLQIEPFTISSFSQGSELQSALRVQHFEIIIFDYYLGETKTGVEWLTTLRQARFIRPGTGIIFITSDRLPQTIGEIIDCEPDLLLIKPYNLQTLSRGIKQYLTYRKVAHNALQALDDQRPDKALKLLKASLEQEIPLRIRTDIIKLKARLLFESGDIQQARQLYEAVLVDCERVLWAQWGKVKCLYMEGRWHHCQDDLTDLIESELAKNKAFEWLAGLSFEQKAYEKAEYYLDHIAFSALSIAATRLKSLTYQRQDRVLDAIELLQKKRHAHTSSKETFNEFTFELAEFYLSIAEHQPAANRSESLSQARRLIGVAGRHNHDAQHGQKQAVLMAYAAVLDGDEHRAQVLFDHETTEYFARTDAATLINAAKVYSYLRQPEKVREMLSLAHDRTQDNLSLAQRTSHQEALRTAEQQLGVAAEQAFELNDIGTKWFLQKRYLKAMYYFYQAHTLLPGTAAFALNLLHCMTEAGIANYRTTSAQALFTQLTATTLSASNQNRLQKIEKMYANKPELNSGANHH
ncbi:response regulator [Salinimonas sp. HHU 13199]|uniref:Response regulator n=1 Tax=Salinimonas profundi TaxID=2729140 RepID=A0ABR8LGA6_9ALTE|nr:response regulator [Salinimonas profundi]MBD3584558.1 response regulator [Salinimonas profundi]